MSPEGFGIIAPHPPIMVEVVGGARTQVTKDSLDALHTANLAIHAYDPDLIVIMSPHGPALADAFAIDTSERAAGTFGQFGAARPRYEYSGRPDFAHALIARAEREGIPVVDRAADPRLDPGHLDHGVLVPMSFLDPEGRWPLVELSLSYLPYELHRKLGVLVRAVADELGVRTAFVASGDCSHRLTADAPAGYSPIARDLDAAIVEHVQRGDFLGLMHLDPGLVEAGGECGLRSFITLGGFIGDDSPARVLAYEGPWGVGYLTALVGRAALAAATPETGRKGGAPGENEREVVALARSAIDAYVREGVVIDTPLLEDPELPPRSGAFVTLHRQGALRGCIGTILPTQPTLAAEVVHNAIEAAVNDPRFPPLSAAELDDLDVKVDVLRQPESCTIDDLDPKRYGVIVSSGWRRGLLLPDLEGVEDVETQVQIALRKAGIGPGEPCSYERFRVDRYE